MNYTFICFVLIISLLLGFGLNSCTVTTNANPKSSKTQEVGIKLFTFKPDTVEVKPGTTVVWTNQDAVDHTVTHGTQEKPASAFNSGFFNQGETFSFTFTEAGEYPYFCERHPFMQGIVKVAP